MNFKKDSSSKNRDFSRRNGSSDRPRRNFGPRRDDDRPRRNFGPYRDEDRPRRKFSQNRDDERPGRSFSPSREDERPRRNFGPGRFEDRPRRNFSAGRGEDRPRRNFSAGRGEDRPRKSFGGRKLEDRPGRSFSRDRFDDKFTKSFTPGRGEERKRTFSRNRSEDKPKKAAPQPAVPTNPDEVRLNKYIANSGVCSRREADELIVTGLITVNGEVVTQLGTKVNVNDDIRYNGQRLKGEKKVYILMNKPKDFVTTTSDPNADKCVMDLISPELCPERVYPVGRLDKATTGVLLLTNDGALSEQLTHPSYNRKKIYQATLNKNLKKNDFNTLLEGIQLEDGFIAADALSYLDGKDDMVGIEIHSGHNRIVRRMFEHIGYEVKKLDRVYFAGLTKKNIKRGQWRFLTDSEVNLLKMGSYE